MKVDVRRFGWALVGLALVAFALAQTPLVHRPGAADQATGAAAKAQPRPHGQRMKVDPSTITVEDGDGVIIRWSDKDPEIVRILGIDTPEIRRLEHNLPYDQPFGPEAKAFAQGAFAAATEVELLVPRPSTLTTEPSPISSSTAGIIRSWPSRPGSPARRSATTVTTACPRNPPRSSRPPRVPPPLPFEPPHQYRARMRTSTTWMKQNGQYPTN